MNETLSLPQIITRIAQLTGADEQTVSFFIREFIESLETCLSQGQSVKLKHFGHFFATSNDIRFIPDPALAEAVNQPFAAFEAIELPDSIPDDTLAMLNAMSEVQVKDEAELDLDQDQDEEPEQDTDDILDQLHIPRQAYSLETEELEEKSLADALLEIQGTKAPAPSEAETSTPSHPSNSSTEEPSNQSIGDSSNESDLSSTAQTFEAPEEKGKEGVDSETTDTSYKFDNEVEEEAPKTTGTEDETNREALFYDLESPVEHHKETQAPDKEETQIVSSSVNDNGTLDFNTSSKDASASEDDGVSKQPEEKAIIDEEGQKSETAASETNVGDVNDLESISDIPSPSHTQSIVEEETSASVKKASRIINFDDIDEDEEDLSLDISTNGTDPEDKDKDEDIRFEDDERIPSSSDDGFSPLLDEESPTIYSDSIEAEAPKRPDSYVVVESGGGIHAIDEHPYDTPNKDTDSETTTTSSSADQQTYFSGAQSSDSDQTGSDQGEESHEESASSNFDVEGPSNISADMQSQEDEDEDEDEDKDVEDTDAGEDTQVRQYQDTVFHDLANADDEEGQGFRPLSSSYDSDTESNPDSDSDSADKEDDSSTTPTVDYPELKGYTFGHLVPGTRRIVLDDPEPIPSNNSDTSDEDDEDYDDNYQESDSNSWLRWIIGILIALILICGGLYLLERYGYGYNYVWSLISSNGSSKVEQTIEGPTSTSIVDQSIDTEELDVTDQEGQLSESEEIIEETPEVDAEEEARLAAELEAQEKAKREAEEKAKREAEEKRKAEAQEKAKREQEEQAKREQEKRIAQEKERAAAEADWKARQDKKAEEQRLAQQKEREKAEADKRAQERKEQEQAQSSMDRRFANGPVQDVVSPSRTLAMMAADYYGSSYYWVYIYQENPYLGNPRQIMTGTKVNIPPLSKYVKGNPEDPKNIQKAINLAESINSMYK